jgi:hypothetical protein
VGEILIFPGAAFRPALPADTFKVPVPHPTLPWPLYAPGLALGVLTQLIAPPGAGKVEAALQMLEAQPACKVAWAERRLTAYPPGLKQRGARLLGITALD